MSCESRWGWRERRNIGKPNLIHQRYRAVCEERPTLLIYLILAPKSLLSSFISSAYSSNAAAHTMAARWATQRRPAGEELEEGLTGRLLTSSALGNM